MAFKTWRLSDRVFLIQETGVANFMRCNIWHVRGRDLDEGDVLDLGDCAFQILPTPGHSPGSISLWDPKARTVFSGDALYDGDLLDNFYHSDPTTLRRTLARLQSLGAEVFHGGHYPSFGKTRMTELVEAYSRGENTLMCLGSAIDAPSPLLAGIGDGVGCSAEHLVA